MCAGFQPFISSLPILNKFIWLLDLFSVSSYDFLQSIQLFTRQILETDLWSYRELTNSKKTSLWLPYQPSSGRQTLSLAFYSSCSSVSTKKKEDSIHSDTELSIAYFTSTFGSGTHLVLDTDHDGSETGSMLSLCVFQVCQQSPMFVFCFYFVSLYSMHPRDRLDRSSRNESDRLTRSGLDARQD